MTGSPRWFVAVTEYAGLTPYTGGIGRHYASLLPALVRLGIRIDLVVFCSDAPLEGADLEGVTLVDYISDDRRPAMIRLVTRAIEVRRLADRADYDVVFLAEWGGLGALLPSGAPLISNLATSYQLADWIAGPSPRSFLARVAIGIQKRLETRQMRRSTGLVPISRAVGSWNERTVTRLPPAIVVRNCIDVPDVQLNALAGQLPDGWPSSEGPVILFVGRLERRKGIEAAMQAFSRLAQARPDVQFVFAGGFGYPLFEPSEHDLLAGVAPDQRERFTFLGHVAGPELFAAVNAATVGTCPSLWEGFGNVALEIKAIGTPLVVTTGSGFDDFCRDGHDCIMVTPGDGAALAHAIGTLLDDHRLSRSLADRARADINAFTADAVAPDLVEAVERLLDGRQGGRGARRGKARRPSKVSKSASLAQSPGTVPG